MIESIVFLAAAATTDPAPEVTILGVVLTSVLSTTVIGALIAGIFGYINNKRNARIAERRNDLDANEGLIGRYKEAAAEERAQKESALETVNNMLTIAQGQAEALRGTVATLNLTIQSMKQAADAQQDLIDTLTKDRDRIEASLATAMAEIERQKDELIRRQKEILAMTDKAISLPEVEI